MVSSGFWGGRIVIVPTSGAPDLIIKKVGKDTVTLSWDDPEARWTLYESTDLKKSSWKRSTATATRNNDTWTVEIPKPSSKRFFRLQLAPVR